MYDDRTNLAAAITAHAANSVTPHRQACVHTDNADHNDRSLTNNSFYSHLTQRPRMNEHRKRGWL